MKNWLLSSLVLASLVGLAGCERPQDAAAGAAKREASPPNLPIERWYSQEQVARGNTLFQDNCADCHQPDASGTPSWRQLDVHGKYPPPPLNGTAHAWHHPLPGLRQTVRIGGVPLGGTMPAFGDKLNAEEIDDILAWVQSHWSAEIYGLWHQRSAQSHESQRPMRKG